MALIKCPECGKEVSDRAGQCPNCGYPVEKIFAMKSVGKNVKKISVKSNILDRIKMNKKAISIIIMVVCMAIIFKSINGSTNREYCEGLKWGTSLERVEKKYPDLDYDADEDYYYTLVDSFADCPNLDFTDMNFYFDDDDKLYKIEVSIVENDAGEYIYYFTKHFNDIYKTDYEAEYDKEYHWYGDKTKVTMTTGDVLVKILYEEYN